MEGVSSHSSNFQSNSNLKILYFNARSLLPKFDELSLLTDSHRPDVICITESWLCPDILDSEISISGYQTMRLDRNRHGRGVLMYVLDKDIVKRLPSHASLELLTVTLIMVIIDLVCHCFIILLVLQLMFCIPFIVILSQLTFLSFLVLYSLVTLVSTFLTLLTLLLIIFVISCLLLI